MPGLVLGFLGAHMLFIIIAITLAVGDKSFAVVPDYYQKSQAWDTHKAELAASEALGWGVVVEPSREVSLHGERELAVVLHDAGGEPIDGAHVVVTLYHHARAKQVVQLELAPTGTPGRYAVTAELRAEGLWDISARITRGDEAYLHEEKAYIQGVYGRAGR